MLITFSRLRLRISISSRNALVSLTFGQTKKIQISQENILVEMIISWMNWPIIRHYLVPSPFRGFGFNQSQNLSAVVQRGCDGHHLHSFRCALTKGG